MEISTPITNNPAGTPDDSKPRSRKKKKKNLTISEDKEEELKDSKQIQEISEPEKVNTISSVSKPI